MKTLMEVNLLENNGMKYRFFARIIHMCDTIDIFCRSMKSDSDEWKRTEEFVIKSKDKMYV